MASFHKIASNIIHSQLIDSGNLCNGSITCGVSSGNSHGTAVAQIVVGMAPDVNLRVYVIGNSVDFNNAIDDAIANGADIVTISLGFPTLGGDGTTGFFRDGTSTVAKKVDLAQNAGLLVTVSVGNEGFSHWQGNYAISPVVPSTIGIGELEFYESVMNFQPSASGLQRACLPVIDFGDRYFATWNDWVTSFEDYDFYLYDSNMLIAIPLELKCATKSGL